MRISRKLQACLTIKENQEFIFRESYSRAFLGVLPSLLALRPNTKPALARPWRKCPSSFLPLHTSLKDTERLCCLCGHRVRSTQIPINHFTMETDTSIISQQLRNRQSSEQGWEGESAHLTISRSWPPGAPILSKVTGWAWVGLFLGMSFNRCSWFCVLAFVSFHALTGQTSPSYFCRIQGISIGEKKVFILKTVEVNLGGLAVLLMQRYWLSEVSCFSMGDSTSSRVSWKSAFSGKTTHKIAGTLTKNFPSKRDMSSKHLFQSLKVFHSLLTGV